MTVPQITPEQRAQALEKAVESRRRRREAKEALARGEMGLADVLASGEGALARMPVRELICSLPGYGPARADKVMGELSISASRKVAGLGPRQREALLARLG